MTSSLDREAEKMLRVPGIMFADGESGRRARVAGTGLDVFEVILSYLAVGRHWNRLKLYFPQATEGQLRAAVT